MGMIDEKTAEPTPSVGSDIQDRKTDLIHNRSLEICPNLLLSCERDHCPKRMSTSKLCWHILSGFPQMHVPPSTYKMNCEHQQLTFPPSVDSERGSVILCLPLLRPCCLCHGHLARPCCLRPPAPRDFTYHKRCGGKSCPGF